MLPSINTIKEIVQDVYETLGSGFSEEVYDRAMQVGLRLAKIGYEGQKVVELKYKDHYVGEGYPDLVVQLEQEKVIVELKAISGELWGIRRPAVAQLSEDSERQTRAAHQLPAAGQETGNH